MSKHNISSFIYGVIAGTLCACLLIGAAFFGYKTTARAINAIERKANNQNMRVFAPLREDFFLGFEKESDMAIFQVETAGMELSSEHAIEGSRSLLVEFPAETKYPGITFDLFGKDCFDWSKIKSFAFDAFNSTNAQTMLIIQIRSGSNYPKKQFKKEIYLVPSSWNKIVISREEMENTLDMDKVSHLTIFMSNPITTFKVYFDNMKADKNA